ncbi:probable ERG5-C-22 sterol desaturase [Serendipita indica DSM 11827]|uniref:sterol 22-desaturase n=1 Tax=Serendipita indica (strain DSM 11827) TaxID=1109443 RepID=G4TSW4_SERID|nr:probable ERG5-C-22 sterol desaturase [Serendipita indica DSM 11827]
MVHQSSIVSPSSVPSQIFSSAETLSNKLLSDKTSSIIAASLTAVLALLILEQTVYRAKKGSLPGSRWTIPIIGKFANSLHPTLEGYKRQWASGELSALSVFHIFIVIASTNEYTRKILNSPAYAEPCLVASAKQVLCPENWVFLNGKAHVDYRRTLNSLFTRKALAVYLEVQDTITRHHFALWLKTAEEVNHKPQSIMHTVRYLNMHTSLRVFCGKHIPEEAITIISDNYWKITLALELVNFPLALPGTKVWGAIQSRKIALAHLENAAKLCKEYIADGGEVHCMMDQWVKDIQEAKEKAIMDGGKLPREFDDHEMGLVILSFLFASQDAMSSGVIYMFQHLADYPEIMEKVREEQRRVRGGEYSKPITLDMIDNMPYLRAVIKESLRIKPPVTMVPYKATKPFPISSFYTVPANSMVIPSLYPSLHDPNVYPNPDQFLPERWLDPESSANANPKNYLVFGAGPHRCIGVEYTNINMACVMANAVSLMDWRHERTPDSDGVQMIATIFPKDGCLLDFTPRNE